MAAPATPEIDTDVIFRTPRRGVCRPEEAQSHSGRAIIQPGAIANKPPTSGLATGDYILVQKADGKLYKCPAAGVGSGASKARKVIRGRRTSRTTRTGRPSRTAGFNWISRATRPCQHGAGPVGTAGNTWPSLDRRLECRHARMSFLKLSRKTVHHRLSDAQYRPRPGSDRRQRRRRSFQCRAKRAWIAVRQLYRPDNGAGHAGSDWRSPISLVVVWGSTTLFLAFTPTLPMCPARCWPKAQQSFLPAA